MNYIKEYWFVLLILVLQIGIVYLSMDIGRSQGEGKAYTECTTIVLETVETLGNIKNNEQESKFNTLLNDSLKKELQKPKISPTPLPKFGSKEFEL